jgi:DNA polymerase
MHEPLSRRTSVPANPTVVQHTLHRDYETRSCASLKACGAPRYAADPSTTVLCMAYAVDDGPVRTWLPGDSVPKEFVEAAIDQNWIVAAHGDHFETAIERHVLHPLGWPLIPLERHRSTMSMSLALGLPARLAAVADALELARRSVAAALRLLSTRRRSRARAA